MVKRRRYYDRPRNINRTYCLPFCGSLCYNEAIVQFCTIGGYAVGSYKVLKASDVRQRWSEVVNEVARDKTRVIVEKSGVPVAGVVSPQDLEWLQERDRRMAELRETMDEMRQAFGDVPPEEFNRAVDRAVQESRSRTDGPPPA